MNKETLVLLVNSVNSVVGFRKHHVILVNYLITVFLQLRGGIPPRARAWPETNMTTI